jgi:hypothetical protein
MLRGPSNGLTVGALALLAAVASTQSGSARELGVGPQYTVGSSLGTPSGGNPPVGLYFIAGANYYKTNIVDQNGNNPTNNKLSLGVSTAQFVWVPGWTLFGASYSATVLQPYVANQTTTNGVTTTTNGFADTLWSPLNLSWALGNAWFASVGFGFYAPIGTISGANGTSGIAAPFWTAEPSVALSYLGNGYNLTAKLAYNINTANPNTKFRSGDQLFLDLTATKTFGKWELGPVGYYHNQVTADSDPNRVYAFLNTIGVPVYTRPTSFAVGGLIAYNITPEAKLRLVVTDDVYARSAVQGWRVWTKLGIKLYGDDARPASSSALIHK